ncbi:MAG TPA: UbiA-like polyprenyltransferase [Longimicrobiales bacterium]|nr:UbiA-like polyprenyltransferase [Longimicrobiales bacterium]
MTGSEAVGGAVAGGGDTREGQTYEGGSLASRYASFVKLPHTLFALPFAGVGAVLASYQFPGGLTFASAGWIVLAFTAARFAAMGFNRVVDRDWDALNPRTAMRELPAGRLTLPQAVTAVVAASATFVFAAWMLNPLCGWLSPVALGWVFFYSYTKRFTAFAHHVLGIALGIAPAGAFLAVSGAWPEPWYALPLLSAAVMFWVAGFDVIYSVQDVEFDRAHGLHSLPVRYGAGGALRLARVFHATSFLLFAAVGLLGLFPVGRVFLGGVVVMAALLVYEHRVIGGDPAALDLRRVDRAFFHANVAVSTSFFVFTLADRLLR